MLRLLAAILLLIPLISSSTFTQTRRGEGPVVGCVERLAAGPHFDPHGLRVT